MANQIGSQCSSLDTHGRRLLSLDILPEMRIQELVAYYKSAIKRYQENPPPIFQRRFFLFSISAGRLRNKEKEYKEKNFTAGPPRVTSHIGRTVMLT